MHRPFTTIATKESPPSPVRRRLILGVAAAIGCALGRATAQDAPERPARLELSPAQRRLIYASLSQQTHLSTAAPATFGAAIGAVVPPAVELVMFPETVVEIVPETRGYAFAFVAGQVLIVEPQGRRIVEIITRS